MKVIIAGGSGHVGAVLRRKFATVDHEVVVLSRRARAATGGCRVVPWDGRTVGDWTQEVDGADVVINLAGRSVDCRYGAKNLGEMLESRLWSTTAIGRAIAQAARPPRVWLQAATATIYAHRFDAANDEASGIIGGDEPSAPPKWNASVAIARAWEEAVDTVETPHTRKVILRSAMVMSRDRGSVFDVLATLARRHLGGTIGDGRQFVSWIPEHDFATAIQFLIDRADIAGAINVCAPNPLPNAAFMRDLRTAVNRRWGLPTPGPLLELGCWALRTESELVLKSRRVVPGRLQAAGFEFTHPTWSGAAQALVVAQK
ncbi:epimerase [Synoicihabitans lomoniglobus]|uniref:DUF1731 domain-containing protein n=1 Tax=Synoicihabitans lomoniglobus TaxID=2909285 RepID=A0AAE9ZW48_9BACT|nr:DUF1731 domain-containing protein [Opitutaceae bacterium LMO-M01]WED64496.1 DUF1731 domain-containing protein [Opitutaceae bacterium LMO-M01]